VVIGPLAALVDGRPHDVRPSIVPSSPFLATWGRPLARVGVTRCNGDRPIIEGVSRRSWHVAPLVLAMTLGAVAGAGAQGPQPSSEAIPPTPESVSGTTFDTSGLPLPGVSLWIETELVVGTPGRATSGPDGRYLVTGLSPFFVYSAHARYPVEYAGRSWCLRLAPRTSGDDAVSRARSAWSATSTGG